MVIAFPQHAIPPLENGDRLSRAEFSRRYRAMSDCKAELIEGIVYMAAAALRLKSHGQPHGRFMTWLGVYEASTPGTWIGDAPTVLLDENNEPQPDLALLIDPVCGGQTRLTETDYIEGSPELLAEVAASTVSIDLGSKKTAYERNGVREYLVWRVLEQQLDWFVLEEGCYVALLADGDGVTRSRVFPGLWLDRSALIQGDMQGVLKVLQAGIESNAHQIFVAQLELNLEVND
jgi:Putative restriction endonuclease